MGSKRNKKSKQDYELFSEEKKVKKIRDELGKDESLVKSQKRKKKQEEDINEPVPKKIKKQVNDLVVENSDGTSKSKKNKKHKIKSETYGENDEENDELEIIKIEENYMNDVKVENPSSPEKKKEVITWPDKDLNELINKMEQNIPAKDTLAYSTRAEKLDWDNVAFNDYTVEECKKTWGLLQKRIRRFRLLTEVLHDAREYLNNPRANGRNNRHPDKPKRPLSSYIIFYKRKKDKIMRENPGVEGADLVRLVGMAYKSLAPEKREKYEKLSQQSKEEYQRNMKIFFNTHPDYVPPKVNRGGIEKEKPPKKTQTPFNLYFLSELKSCPSDVDRNMFKEKCKEQWKQLTDKKKVMWINLAEQDQAKYEKDLKDYKEKHPEFETNPVKSVLTKEEKFLKERMAGKPVKPPNSAYGLFSKLLLKSDEIKQVNPKDRMNYIANQWKTCPDDEKNQYRDRALNMMHKYKKEYDNYLESLPEDKREEEIQQSQRKIKTSSASSKPRKPAIRKPVKKEEQVQNKFKEPEQPPISACKYYAQTYYKGNGNAVQAWKSLSPAEKQKYENELSVKKQEYIVKFEKFLKSLSKEDLEEFSKTRQLQVKADDDNDESTECSSASENEDGEYNETSDSD